MYLHKEPMVMCNCYILDTHIHCPGNASDVIQTTDCLLTILVETDQPANTCLDALKSGLTLVGNQNFVNLPCTDPSSQQTATRSHIGKMLPIATYHTTSPRYNADTGSGDEHAISCKRSFTHIEWFVVWAPRLSGEMMH